MTFVVWLGIAIVVLLGVDAAITWWVRREAADRISHALRAPVEVHVRGWPAMVKLPLGRLRAVDLVARRVPAAGTHLSELDVELHGVRPETDGNGRYVVASTGGRFTARLDPEAFRSLAPLPSSVVDVRFAPDRIRFELPGGVAVPTSVSLDEDVVVLTPQVERLGVLSVLRFAFPLEELPFGATVDGVEVRQDVLVLGGAIGPLELNENGVNRRL